jgi:hypothetical protein
MLTSTPCGEVISVFSKTNWYRSKTSTISVLRTIDHHGKAHASYGEAKNTDPTSSSISKVKLWYLKLMPNIP